MGYRYGWQVKTYCNFGRPDRRDVLSTHSSLDAAKKAFKRLRKIYSHESHFDTDREEWRCWQVDYAGNIINDTGTTNRAVYA